MSHEVIRPGERVGFIGLGNMGTPMAARLLGGGYVVVGFDPNPAAGSQLEEHGGFERAASMAEACQGVKAIVLMLPNSAVVHTVLTEGSVFDSADLNALIIDMSSSQPSATVEETAEAVKRGLRMIDAPVSGGVPAARDGSLTIMAGGPQAWVDEAMEILSLMGKHIVHAGDAGAGHALKAINNFLSASTLLASSEALVVGAKFGLKPDVMTDAINSSSGRSWSSQTKWPRYVLPRTFASGFLMSLLVKDTRIAVELARESGIPVPYAETTLQMWEQAMSELPDGADHTDIHRFVENHAGFQTPQVEGKEAVL